jgi:RNA polymerase sigma factor (sigma-70 family)
MVTNAEIIACIPQATIIARQLVSYNPTKRQMHLEDYISAGLEGLVKARDSFKDGKNSFKTYATYRIKGEILDYIRENDHVKRHTRARIKDGSIEDIEEPFTMTGKDWIDETVPDFNAVNPESRAIAMEMIRKAESICESLNPRTIAILRAHFVEGKTLKTIGKKYKVSESRMSQVLNGVLRLIASRIG